MRYATVSRNKKCRNIFVEFKSILYLDFLKTIISAILSKNFYYISEGGIHE